MLLYVFYNFIFIKILVSNIKIISNRKVAKIV